jgi:hypothetical protein
MAYLPETSEWGAGIYQLEKTDPAGGGSSGILNLPLKAIANRLKYLKQYADEVQSSRGEYGDLKERLDSLIPIDEEIQNANAGALMEAIGMAGIANREILKEHTQRKQTGVIFITNKGIVSGCTVSKSTTAIRNLSCASGIIFSNGQLFPFSGTENGVIIPSNESQTDQTYYAYLHFEPDGSIEFARTSMGQKVPDTGIPLYLVTVPPGNNDQNAPNLANVTLSSVRRIETNFPVFYSTPLYANVVLPYPLPDPDYAVNLDLISITGSGFQRGEIYPMDRNVNGFKIYYNGVADDLLIRWEISRPGL